MRNSSKLGIPAAILLLTITLFTIPGHAVTVGNNVDLISAPERQQAEPTITVDPRNASILVAGAQDYNFAGLRHHRWHAIYRSTDGGQTWINNLLPGFPGDNSPEGANSPLHAYSLTSDPVMAFDNQGNLYYAGIALNVTFGGAAAFVAKYTNDGATYAGVSVIPGFGDFPKIATDNSGGPFNGHVYLTSTFGFQVSTDGGNTFSSPISIGAEITGIKVGPTGTVYIVAEQSPPRGPGPTNIIVSTSTDGGQTLNGRELAAFNITSVPFNLPGNQFREFTLPEIGVDNNGVYVTWADYRTGLSNILFVRSTDGGQTWSNPITVNDVNFGQHFTPTIVASGGIVSVAWYDDRLSNTPDSTINALDVFYAQSNNAGQSFGPNVRMTSVSFNPNQAPIRDFARGGKPFLGDYISIDAGPGFVQTVWSDDRNACDLIDPNLGCVDEDIFTATITV